MYPRSSSIQGFSFQKRSSLHHRHWQQPQTFEDVTLHRLFYTLFHPSPYETLNTTLGRGGRGTDRHRLQSVQGSLKRPTMAWFQLESHSLCHCSPLQSSCRHATTLLGTMNYSIEERSGKNDGISMIITGNFALILRLLYFLDKHVKRRPRPQEKPQQPE